jgi:MFS family permease
LIFDRSFPRLWIGNTASGLATWALPFVLGLAIVSKDIAAAEAGLALAARTFGFILAMPVGGVLTDRSGPRRMILLASLIAALGILPVMAGLAGLGGVAAIVAGAGVAGFGQGACRAAYQAIVPRIVPDAGRQSANAALTISIRVSTLVGPALATWATLQFGTAVTFAGIAAFWILSALLPPWPASPVSKSPPAALNLARFVSELNDGLAEARRHPWFVAGLAALTVVIAFGYSVTNVLLPQVSQNHFGGPQLLTISITSYTLGALAGALLIARWRPRAIGWIALCGLGLYGLVPLSLIHPGHSILPVAAFFLAGVGIELFNVPWFTATQREVPADKLARVSSIDFLFSYGLAPLGLAGIAPLAESLGIESVLLLCGLVCIGAPASAMAARGSRDFITRGR